jgi:pyruvate, orthophosphate dikinase
MVYGNLGPSSGTGVCFTRNPATGEKSLYGEYLVNAQGEDVVAGLRTPQPIAVLEKEFPEAYATLIKNLDILEHEFKDMQVRSNRVHLNLGLAC